RGNPIGSQVSNGSLISDIGAMLVPNPVLWDSIVCFPTDVYGIMASCAGSDGISRGPLANTPSRYLGVGSQIPDRSCTGAGPGFFPAASSDSCFWFHPSRWTF